MKRVAFVVHAGREAALQAASELVEWLAERNVGTGQLPGEEIGAAEKTEAGELAVDADLVVSFGGDGTFLRAARIASAAGCPVLGVKVGRLGFLTEVEPGEAPELVESYLAGGARVEKRMALTARAEGAEWREPEWALNEVIVEKRTRHRLIKLALSVNQDPVTTVSADGVIVATPTGSTAYSFSARGPIVSPELACLIVTPVAAHMVFDRSIVLGAAESVQLKVVGEEPGVLSADGREALELPVGSVVRIAAAAEPALLVRREGGRSFFALVRDKFGLPGGESN
ncbi:MAG: NAD(+)/NADH kinase [Actinomycetota bacterium]